MKNIKAGSLCLYFACLFLLGSFPNGFAVTNSLPQLQALYGGQISGLNIIAPSDTTNQVRIFLKTDFSANSIFYADINYSLADPFSTNNYSWRVVPDFNAQAGFGTVSEIAAHQASGRLFVANDDGLLSCTTVAGSLATNISSSGGSTFLTVCIQDSVLLSIASRHGSDVLCFGNLDSSGNFTQDSGSPINIGLSAFSSTAIQLAVNPVNHHVYIIDSYGTNGILKSSAAYDALSATTTFSRIDISSVITNWVMGRRIGFGPDGRMFIGAKVSSSSINTIAYSDNDGTNWTTVSTGVIGKGENFDTTGSASQYNVVFGRAVSTNKGAAGSWFTLGVNDPAGQIRANDSSSKFDPLNPQLMYFASDQGVGCTTNGGPNLKEIDFGLEAVAIQGLDMNDAKTLGWTASASGLRRGVGSAGAVQWESTGMFPMEDSAPYYSVAIDKTDSSGNTVYAGNGYIYKTTDGGTNWTRAYMSSTDTSSYMASIAAAGNNVFAGAYEWTFPYAGGLLYSADAGATWENFALEGTNGINVNKVLLTEESGIPVAYVGAEFNTNSSLGGHIYRVTQSGASHVLLGSDNISIRDLAKDSAGGIYASGWNQIYQPMVFYKSASSSTWTMLTTNGLSNISFYSSSRGPVITIGRDSSSNDMPVVGAGVDLYYLTSGAATWTTSTNLHYPRGTKLNVIYWDDLLVGTTIGLYGQGLNTQAPRADPGMVILSNWYLWLSAMGYQLSGPFNFGVAAVPVAADFDADGKADPTMVDGALWYIWFTGAGYQLSGGPWNFGVAGDPVAADFDGDRKADPAMVVNTLWYIWFSGTGYQLSGGPWNFGVAGYPVAADFDADGKGDPCMVVGPLWYIWFSRTGYQLSGGPWNFGVEGIPVAGDFDADGKADPAMVVDTLWYIWFSGTGYQLSGGPWNFGVDGFPVAADFDGR